MPREALRKGSVGRAHAHARKAQEPRLFGLQIRPQGVCICAIHVALIHNGEGRLEARGAKGLRLCSGLRVLRAKLVAGVGHHGEALRAKGRLKGLQSLKLGREPARTSGVHNEGYLAALEVWGKKFGRVWVNAMKQHCRKDKNCSGTPQRAAEEMAAEQFECNRTPLAGQE